MSDIISAIHSDMKDYEYLCEKYGEKVKYSNWEPDCYGPHAKKLKEREEDKRQAEWAKKKKEESKNQSNYRYAITSYDIKGVKKLDIRKSQATYFGLFNTKKEALEALKEILKHNRKISLKRAKFELDMVKKQLEEVKKVITDLVLEIYYEKS